jgi:hypothetical protein
MAYARAILEKQADLLMVDAFTIDRDGDGLDAVSFPLLPLLSQEEGRRFLGSVRVFAC